MNVKTTLYLMCVGFKRCFIKLSFHFEGVLLAVRGCTCMLRGCSRTLETLNSPPLGAGGGNLKKPGSTTRATSTLAYSNSSPSSHGSEMVKSDRRSLILTKPNKLHMAPRVEPPNSQARLSGQRPLWPTQTHLLHPMTPEWSERTEEF